MSMMLKRMLRWVISPALSFLLGILIGAPIWLRQYEWLTWSKIELSDIISIVGLVINTTLAIIIVVVLQKLQDIRRVEKNILIERIKEEMTVIKSFVAQCCKAKEQTDFSSVTGFFKTVTTRISKITDTHGNCIKESNDLIEGITALKSLLTDPRGTTDMTIDKNKISLKPKRIQEINIRMAEVENCTLDIIVCINRQTSKKG